MTARCKSAREAVTKFSKHPDEVCGPPDLVDDGELRVAGEGQHETFEPASHNLP